MMGIGGACLPVWRTACGTAFSRGLRLPENDKYRWRDDGGATGPK